MRKEIENRAFELCLSGLHAGWRGQGTGIPKGQGWAVKHIAEGRQKKGTFKAGNVVSEMLDDTECNCFQNLRKMTAERLSLDWVVRDLTGSVRLQCP